MKLTNTSEMMNCKDYKERFRAEYYQLVIRLNGLKNMLDKWDKSELTFIPTCPRSIYNTQITAMSDYLEVLKVRAIIEKIEFKEVVD